ncbi:hypothetical protein NA57DRAFT_38451 [Rhizodiscina lignyota]|uniref:Lea domain protein n=1 Tax=Rhizodiscina lignyota TaxID=1504668 RepID=A0A9P4M7M8_9PEZI|nr:hypothetical protein NA57DRAFT_38451 [Rhizodiscina lignyota]
MYRAAVLRQARLFSTTPRVQKVLPDAVKEPLKKVDRTVSDAAVAGIEAGEKVTDAVKQTVGMSKGEAQGKASEVAGEAKGKANELAGKAKGTAEEVKGKVQ